MGSGEGASGADLEGALKRALAERHYAGIGRIAELLALAAEADRARAEDRMTH